MSEPKPTGGPAFPPHTKQLPGGQLQGGLTEPETAPAYWEGMTLRDYFAGQAFMYLSAHAAEMIHMAQEHNVSWAEAVAKGCYEFADAMLAERQT